MPNSLHLCRTGAGKKNTNKHDFLLCDTFNVNYYVGTKEDVYEWTMNKQDPCPTVCPLQSQMVEFGLSVHSVIYRHFNFTVSTFCYLKTLVVETYSKWLLSENVSISDDIV